MFILWEINFCHPRDFVIDHSIDIFCMSETWPYDNHSAVISALTPESHVLHHVTRPDKEVVQFVASLTNDYYLETADKRFQVFRMYGSSIIKWEKKVIMNLLFRPLRGNFSLFLQEIESLILESEINEAEVFNLAGFDIWVDDIWNNDAQSFLR